MSDTAEKCTHNDVKLSIRSFPVINVTINHLLYDFRMLSRLLDCFCSIIVFYLLDLRIDKLVVTVSKVKVSGKSCMNFGNSSSKRKRELTHSYDNIPKNDRKA